MRGIDCAAHRTGVLQRSKTLDHSRPHYDDIITHEIQVQERLKQTNQMASHLTIKLKKKKDLNWPQNKNKT